MERVKPFVDIHHFDRCFAHVIIAIDVYFPVKKFFLDANVALVVKSSLNHTRKLPKSKNYELEKNNEMGA